MQHESQHQNWTPWFEKLGAALVLFARQWSRSHSDAEDIVQEAMTRLLRTDRVAHDPAAYLHTSVRNVALEFHRTASRRHNNEQKALRLTDQSRIFECPVENNERQQILERALVLLSPERREVVVMKIWGALTFPQIGDVLEISPNTAASRYRYALIDLRRLLSEEALR